MADRGNVETLQSGSRDTLDNLVVPFEPLTLQRPMALFPKALRIKVGVASLPSDKFLANLLCASQSYLAALRNLFGSDFRNFQNYARMRGVTTVAVRARLVKACEGREELLEQLAASLRVRPDASQFAQWTRAGEGMITTMMNDLLSGSRKCECCQAELVSWPAPWWSKQACRLGQAEYRFVDRILALMLALTLLPVALAPWPSKDHAVWHLNDLCEPGEHPHARWLEYIKRDYRAKDLTALVARARLRNTTAETLQRIARGQALTADAIKELTASSPRSQSRNELALYARAFGFVIDFLMATDSSPEPVSRDTAQAIVKARLNQLYTDLSLPFQIDTKFKKSLPQSGKNSAASQCPFGGS